MPPRCQPPNWTTASAPRRRKRPLRHTIPALIRSAWRPRPRLVSHAGSRARCRAHLFITRPSGILPLPPRVPPRNKVVPRRFLLLRRQRLHCTRPRLFRHPYTPRGRPCTTTTTASSVITTIPITNHGSLPRQTLVYGTGTCVRTACRRRVTRASRRRATPCRASPNTARPSSTDRPLETVGRGYGSKPCG